MINYTLISVTTFFIWDEKMLEEIRYWEQSSWKDFIEKAIVPLSSLAGFLAENLSLDPLGERAKEIGTLAERTIRVAEEVFREPVRKTEQPPEEDVLEAARKFLEIGINMTAGHSKHTFFVWSTRKITKSYLEEHYKELIDPEKFNEVSKILGWSIYWEPLPIKSRILEGYRVYSYPDYLTLFDIYREEYTYFHFRVSSPPEAKETLGGLICKLNEEIWKLAIEKPGLAAGYEFPNIFENYRKKCEEMLSRALWKDEKGFIAAKKISELKTSPDFNYLYEFEGLAVKKLRRYSGYELLYKISVFEFWDTLMPPMFLGKYEFILSSDKSRGVILERW